MKLVINDTKTGKSYSKESHFDLAGMKIGDTIPGENIGLNGYELKITGGSDSSGFPMRKDIPGASRKKAFIGSGPGIRRRRKGLKLRRTVCGNTFGVTSEEANLMIVKYGSESLDKIFVVEKKETQPKVLP